MRNIYIKNLPQDKDYTYKIKVLSKDNMKKKFKLIFKKN